MLVGRQVVCWRGFFVSFRDGRSHPSDVNEGYDHYISQRMKAGTRRLGARARDHMNFETACGWDRPIKYIWENILVSLCCHEQGLRSPPPFLK